MSTLTDPARSAAAVTPSDATDLGAVRGVYVGTAGTVMIRAKGNGAAVPFVAPAGATIPIRARYIYATGTTASNIVVLY